MFRHPRKPILARLPLLAAAATLLAGGAASAQTDLKQQAGLTFLGRCLSSSSSTNRTYRPLTQLSGAAVLSWLLDRNPRNLCTSQTFVGEHRGKHSQGEVWPTYTFPSNLTYGLVSPGAQQPTTGNMVGWLSEGYVPQGGSTTHGNNQFPMQENSQYSYSTNSSFVEIDPRPTKDGVLVMSHDPAVNRWLLAGPNTNFSAYDANTPVSSLTFAQITGSVTAGFDSAFHQQPIDSRPYQTQTDNQGTNSNRPLQLSDAMSYISQNTTPAQVHVRSLNNMVAAEVQAIKDGAQGLVWFDMQGKDYCREVGFSGTIDSLICLSAIGVFKNNFDSALAANLSHQGIAQPANLKVGFMVNMYYDTESQEFDGRAGRNARGSLLKVFGAAGSSQASSLIGLQYMGMDLTNNMDTFNENDNRWATWMKANGFNVARLVWYGSMQNATTYGSEFGDYVNCHPNEGGYALEILKANCYHTDLELSRATNYAYAMGVRSRFHLAHDQIPPNMIVTDNYFQAENQFANNFPIIHPGPAQRLLAFAHTNGDTVTEVGDDIPVDVPCAKEGSECVFPGPGKVEFFTGNGLVTAHAVNRFPCTVAAFGTDPDPGNPKTCSVQLDPPGFVGGTYTMFNTQSPYVLDTGGQTNAGSTPEQVSFSGAGTQQWTIFPVGNGYFGIRNMANGMSLTDTGSGNTLTEQAYQDNKTQWWSFNANSPGVYAVVNASSGLVLSITGSLSASGSNAGLGHTNQTWIMQKTNGSEPPTDTPDADQDTSITPSNYNFTDMDGGNFILVNRTVGEVLDITSDSTASGATAQENNFSGGASQLWTLQSAGDDNTFNITNANSGLVLDSAGGGSGSDVVQKQFTNATSQQWVTAPQTNGGYTLTNVASGQTLGLNTGTGLATQGTSNNTWVFAVINNQLPNATYALTNYYSGLVLAGPSSGGATQATADAGTDQQWITTKQTGGLYTVQGVSSGKCLDSAGSTNSGTQVTLNVCSSTKTSQLWNIATNTRGAFTLINQADGFTLGVQSQNQSGSIADAETWAGNDNQAWIMVPVLPVN